AAPPAPRGLEIARAMALQSYSDRLRGRRALQRGHEIDVIGELDAKQLDGGALAAVVLDRPASEDAAPYMKVMRRCGMLRGQRKSFVVLVMAPAAHNGSAHVALNLASAAALQDEAVLLVDADVRSRTLSRTLCPQATSGIRDVLQGGNEIIDTVWHDPQSFDLLPAAPSGPLRSRAEQRGLAFKTMFAEAAEDYSMVVVDGGSLGSVGIGARIAAAADDIVLVVCSDRPGVDIEIALPDQIKLLGHKVRGAIAITGSGQMPAAI
ncbi:MAG TPA: hypothetical protein VMX97_13105, partial [Hyphomicrobiaceae bacterium]|nr:hypothetical protein [Hyphomicrobiaceae bacterium]